MNQMAKPLICGIVADSRGLLPGAILSAVLFDRVVLNGSVISAAGSGLEAFQAP